MAVWLRPQPIVAVIAQKETDGCLATGAQSARQHNVLIDVCAVSNGDDELELKIIAIKNSFSMTIT